MNLIETNRYGCTGYVFANLDNLLNKRYCFFGKSFNAKHSRGTGTVDISSQTSVSILNQVHGVKIKGCSERGQDGDGIIVKKGEIGGVLTADCVPVIIMSIKNKIGAVLHCGWKGTFLGIIENALKNLTQDQFDLKESVVLIGPSAQDCCYEVGNEFINTLTGIEEGLYNHDNQLLTFKVRNGKYFASVPKLIEMQCLKYGFPANCIYRTNVCTICHNSFFSFRREGDKSGRQLSLLSYK